MQSHNWYIPSCYTVEIRYQNITGVEMLSYTLFHKIQGSAIQCLFRWTLWWFPTVRFCKGCSEIFTITFTVELILSTITRWTVSGHTRLFYCLFELDILTKVKESVNSPISMVLTTALDHILHITLFLF